MIKQAKILFIDDGLINNETPRVNKLIKICERFETLVKFDTQIIPYIDFLDSSGNDIKILFDENQFERIFIHHSYNAPTLIPSNAAALLKAELENKIIFFSGDASGANIKKRDNVYDNFEQYLRFISEFNVFLDYCFDDPYFKMRYATDLIEEIPDDELNFRDNLSYAKLIKLLNEELGYIEIDEEAKYYDILRQLRKHIDKL